MRKGEIWGYTDPATGKQTGWRVTDYFPPMGESARHIAFLAKVKDPSSTTVCVLTPEGLPMLKNGNASRSWKRIEVANAAQ